MRDLERYDVRDPAQLITDIARHVRLTPGSAFLALVRDVSTDQEVICVDQLSLPAEIFEWDEAREELRAVVERWPIPDERPPRHMPVLVVVRPGWCVLGPNEALWLQADRYANHLNSVWSMELILVTEHGWVDFMTHDAGAQPAMLAG